MKNLLRRGLALLLTVVMIASTFGVVSVFAKDEDNPVQPATPATAQVVGYQTPDGVTLGEDDKNAYCTADGIKVGKKITQIGGEDSTKFEITLSVETSQTVTTKGNAVVLVLDFSSSMDDSLGKLKTAAYEFINGLPEGTKVAVVCYGRVAKTSVSWTDKASVNKTTITNLTQSDLGEWSYGSYSCGTNTDAGLTQAYNELLKDDVKNLANKTVVLFTDGVPTYRLDGSVKGSGSDCSKEDCDHAIAAAKTLKDSGANVYSIYMGSLGEKCYTVKHNVCANCGKAESEHITINWEKYCPNQTFSTCNKVTNSTKVCKNCGKSKEDHYYGYYCSNYSWDYRTYEETTHTCANCGKSCDEYTSYYGSNERYNHTKVNGVYYCNSKLADLTMWEKKSDTNYTAGDLLKAISSTENDVYSSSAAELATAFGKVQDKVEITGNDGAGWTVTDPMGQFITYNGIKNDKSYSKGGEFSGTILTWNLDKPSKTSTDNKGKTTYTYTLTYGIELNTAAVVFFDGTLYPTNGLTELRRGEDTTPISFNVPVVSGTAPIFNYTINYWKQTTNKDKDGFFKYELIDGSVEGQQARLYATVEAENKNPNSELYDSGNNVNTGAESVTSLAIAADSKNELNVYYNLKSASVKINYFLKTDVIDVEGKTKEGSYPATANRNISGGDNLLATQEYNCVIPRQMTIGDIQYTFDKSNENNSSPKIESLEPDENEINLYYTGVIDKRVSTTYVVNKHYETYKHVRNENDKIVEEKDKTICDAGDKIESYTCVPVPVDKNVQTKNGTAYEFDCVKLNGSDCTLGNNNTIALNSGENTIDVYYKAVKDDLVDVTINRTYNHTQVTLDGDKVTPYGPFSETVICIDGETYELADSALNNDGKTDYNGKTYAADQGATIKIESAYKGQVINLTYSLTEHDTATIVVNHVYRTWVEETVTTYDEETGEVTGSDTAAGYWRVDDDTHSDKHDNKSVGTIVTLSNSPLSEYEKSYTLDANESDSTTDVEVSNNTLELTLYFNKNENDYPDVRDDADLTVSHTYYGYDTHVNDEGEIVTDNKDTQKYTLGNSVTEDNDKFIGKMGDSVTVKIKAGERTINGETHTFERFDGKTIPTVLKSKDATLDLQYRANISKLEEVIPTVTYQYFTQTQVLNAEKNDVVWADRQYKGDESAAFGLKAETPNPDGKYYYGQFIYVASGKNAGDVLKLEKGKTNFTFDVIEQIPLDKYTITVKHDYTTYEVQDDGSIIISDNEDGENGNDYTLSPELYKGMSFTAEQDTKDGKYTTSDDVVTINEVTEAKEITYSYTRTLGEAVAYRVEHYYDNLNRGETSNPSPTDGAYGKAKGGVAVTLNSDRGDGYTLVKVTLNGEEVDKNTTSFKLSYADTLTKNDSGLKENVIRFYYEKDVTPSYSVKVVSHFNDGVESLEGTTEDTIYVKAGTKFAPGDEYSQKTFRDHTYALASFTPADGVFVDEENGNYVVDLYYTRAYVTVNHSYYLNGTLQGTMTEYDNSVDVGGMFTAAAKPEYNGKTYNRTTEDSKLSVEVAATGSTIDIRYELYYYDDPGSTPATPGSGLPDESTEDILDEEVPLGPAPDGEIEEIPDEDVPLSAMPEEELEEIPDDDVPLDASPKTGDNSRVALYLSAMIASASGLAVLTATGKRKKEDAE